jgi:hypothetical protein
MSQHDYNLANATGASFRADANLALGAIAGNNSGATAPATTFAYQWWADTTAGLLKIRNAANSAWVTVGTLADANLGFLPLSGGTLTGALTLSSGAVANGLTLAAEQASTSGTSIDFTGIPAGVKRITILLNGVSTNGTSNIIVQLGDSGGIETSGYLSSAAFLGNGIAIVAANSTNSFVITIGPAAATLLDGALVLDLQNASTNTFVARGTIGYSSGAAVSLCAGSKALSGTLDRVRITTAGGTDTFDAGAISISYE